MPLSHDPKDTGKDIKELESAGHPHDQSVIALKETGQSKYECGYIEDIINNQGKHKFSDETNGAIEGVLKKKFGMISGTLAAVETAMTAYRVAKKVHEYAPMLFSEGEKGILHPDTNSKIEQILLEKYGPSLKFAEEEPKDDEETEEFKNLSDEEAQALGLEIIKQMIEEWKESSDYKEIEKEEPKKDEKAKFENDKHDKATGRFAPKNGGEGSAKSKDKKNKEKNNEESKEAYSPKEVTRSAKQVLADATELPRKVAKKASFVVSETYSSLTGQYGKKGAAFILGAGLTAAVAGGIIAAGPAGALAAAPAMAIAGLVNGMASRYFERKATRAAQREKAINIKEEAKELAKKILERKKEVENREKVGVLAEEIAARLGENKPESKIGEKIESDVIERLVNELAQKEEKKKESPKEGNLPASGDIKAIRKQVQGENLTASDRARQRQQKIQEIIENTSIREDTRNKKRGVKPETKETPAETPTEAKSIITSPKSVAPGSNTPKKPSFRPAPSTDNLSEWLKWKIAEQDWRKGQTPTTQGNLFDEPDKDTDEYFAPQTVGSKPPQIPPQQPPQGPAPQPAGPKPNAPSGGTGQAPKPQAPNVSSHQQPREHIPGPKPKLVDPNAPKKLVDQMYPKPPEGQGYGDIQRVDVEHKGKVWTRQGGANTWTSGEDPHLREAPAGRVVRTDSSTPTKQGDLGFDVDVPPSNPPQSPPGGYWQNWTAPHPKGPKPNAPSVEASSLPSDDYHREHESTSEQPKELKNLEIDADDEAKKKSKELKAARDKRYAQKKQANKKGSFTDLSQNPGFKKFSMRTIDDIINEHNAKKKFSMEDILKKMEDVIVKYECAPASPMGSNTFVPALNSKRKKIKFANEEDYETIENICIFDEHNGEEEGLDINFDEEMLQKIIDRCNHRIEDTGDMPTVIDGHTEDDEEESKRDVLGFASNFQMGEIGEKKKRKAIFADLHIKKEHMERAKALPRRSIELWHKDLTADPIVLDRAPIDNIALLGDTRPARDLGIMFSKEKISKNLCMSDKYLYAYKESNMDNQLAKELLELVMQLPAMQWAENMARKEAEGAQEAEQMAYDEESADAAPPQEGEQPAPSGEENNGAPEVPEEKKDEESPGPAKLRMQYDQERRKNAKLDAEYKALFSKVAELERQERIAQRKADFLQLEAEGFIFDMADEIDTVKDMEPAKFSKHLSNVRKNYKKAPIGFSFVKAVVPGEEVEKQLTPREVMEKAVKIAEEKYKVK